MATITDRRIISKIIDGNGYYDNDPRVLRIVEYNNQFNGDLAWGVIYPGEDPNRYHNSPACHNPHTIWEAQFPRQSDEEIDIEQLS